MTNNQKKKCLKLLNHIFKTLNRQDISKNKEI